MSTLSFGVGLAGLTAGAILLFTAPRPSGHDAANFQPIFVITPQTALLGASRSF